jgi:hypothetical protein
MIIDVGGVIAITALATAVSAFLTDWFGGRAERASGTSPTDRPNEAASFNDEPIRQPEEDRFGIDPFAQALSTGIGNIRTPIGVRAD